MNALEKYIQSYFGITKDDLNTVSTLFTKSTLDKDTQNGFEQINEALKKRAEKTE